MSEVDRPQNMVPARKTRRTKVERGFMRVVATGGVVGIGVALGAILSHNNVAGWIVGLVVSLVSLLLAAVLWSSRQL
jgi:protein-S-isoprenylcysteine O-methyltransferase Ste14